MGQHQRQKQQQHQQQQQQQQQQKQQQAGPSQVCVPAENAHAWAAGADRPPPGSRSGRFPRRYIHYCF
ncbi:hypothetical protein PLESTB_001431900 [Pleodorina starrii]|uniref:Uncharacterized protein n=1 Tax=Pleodorina starrii TaxID=330485 RepID=A0A9W6BVJ4_9CHLO|nr:hypothetical protein PLESTB_001431900 [Pleodorina starrii]